MRTSSEHVLEINQLNMRYPCSDCWTLNDLSLRMARGDRLALVGPSGCGKSTIAKVIVQLLPPGSICTGGLLLTGQDPRAINRSQLRTLRGEAVGLVFQDPMTRLNPLITIGDHILDTLKAHGATSSFLWRKKRAEELLINVGISPKRFDAYPHEFSGGMRQRLAIALAIALKPPLLIADEPTTSLDAAFAHQIMFELSESCKNLNSALLLITHDLAIASRWCENIAIMDDGRIVEMGSSKDILTNAQSSIGKRLLKATKTKVNSLHLSRHEEPVILEVNNLRCWHSLGGWPWSQNWLKTIDLISFNLHRGETLGIVGESGCGKSTLCKAITGLIPIKGGQIKLQGQHLQGLKGKSLKQTKQILQMIFQDPLACLNPKMKIGEAIADPLLIHKLASSSEAKQQSRELLQQVGLIPPEKFEGRLPRELSGGQQQRVAIARALALKPKVLICDESISMLDAEMQTEILSLLKQLQQKLGLAMLFITHNLNIASYFCHRIIVLDKGKIIEQGNAIDLLHAPQEKITQKLVEAAPKVLTIGNSFSKN